MHQMDMGCMIWQEMCGNGVRGGSFPMMMPQEIWIRLLMAGGVLKSAAEDVFIVVALI